MVYLLAADPWGTPWLAFADTLRAICCIGGLILGACAGVHLVSRRGTAATRTGALALAALAASAIGTEYDHLGDVVTYRLWTNAVGVVLGLVMLLWLLRRARET